MRFFACVAMLSWVTTASALDPVYLADWPTAERVLADQKGEDHPDTLARQMAALHQLDRAIEDLAGSRRWTSLTSDEIRISGQYRAAAERIRDEANRTLSNQLPPGFNGPFAEPPLQRWNSLQWQYERDAEFRAANLGRYLRQPVLRQLAAETATAGARTGGSTESRGLDDRDLDRIGMLLLLVVSGAVVMLSIRFLRRRRTTWSASPAVATWPVDPQLAAAADEVMNSLEPYLAAALAGRQRIPYSDLTDPYVFGFVLEYCRSAVDVVTGGENTSRDRATEVLAVLADTSRFQAIFGGGATNTLATGDITKAAKVVALLGCAAARSVLHVFAGTDSSGKPVSNASQPADDARTRSLIGGIRGNVTLLHPAGPHAAAGHRSIVIQLTCYLLDLVKTPD